MRLVSLWVILFASLSVSQAPVAATEPKALQESEPKAPQAKEQRPRTKSPRELKDELSPKLREAIEGRDWQKVLEILPPNTQDALHRLIRARANFELEKWDEVLKEEPLTDERFKPYLDYLRFSALHSAKKYEDLLKLPPLQDLPESMIQSESFLRAQALIALEKWEEAKTALREFSKKYPYSRLRSDALLQLADVEWRLENKFEALHLYEEIYSQYPLSDANDTASQKLRETGRFQELDAGVHLLRADQLKRAALFNKGISELKKLQSLLPAKSQGKIDLAIAGLEFSRREYSKAAQLAKVALRNKNLENDLIQDWKLLQALSLVRQGRYDDARPIYQELLKSKLSHYEKEGIYLRLGMMALDDQNFEEAQKQFKSLRTEFLKGRYQETAHWFEAWSIHQDQLIKKQKDPEFKYDSKKIEDAIELLSRLPKLPEGQRLAAQALYWQMQLADMLKDEAQKAKFKAKLEKHFKASFHSILVEEKPFGFLDFHFVDVTDGILDRNSLGTSFNDSAFEHLSWKRVEAFANINLLSWSRLELERFRNSLGEKNQSLRNAIAYRLRDLGDWFDLVNYAKMEFEFSIEDLDPTDPIARFHYPQAYAKDVIAAAKEFEVSPYVIWGVMREESRFQPDVMSAAGAVGLLQLMPPLGDRIARALKEKPMGRRGLTDSAKNVRYGVFHIRELMNRVNSLKVPEEFRYPLVIASYNAGFGPVKKWLDTLGTDRVDLFVESIPYTETRNYVKRVLQSANVYYRLYGEKIRTISESKEKKKL